MSKTKNMKEQSFTINTKLPAEVIGLTTVKGAIEVASKPLELLKGTKYYADTITDLKNAEKVLKAAIADPQAKLKAIKEALTGLEKEIKEKALTLVKTTYEQKVNKTTGEVTMVETHNLPTVAFSYTPEKVVKGIDFAAIQAEYDKNGEKSKYRYYFEKQVTYKLDLNKVKADLAEGKKFPTHTTTTKEKISIQTAALTNTKKQDEIIKLIASTEPEQEEE